MNQQQFENNVVSLAAWKNTRPVSNKEKESVRAYLKLLSFHELINETQEVIKEISAGKINQEVELISSEIIHEIDHRASSEGNLALKEALNDIKKKFEANIIRLNDLL